MANADLKLVRQILEAQMTKAPSIKALGDSIRIQQFADPADMTQESAERDVAVQLLDRESALSRQLRAAIERIADGSYGLCLECEEEIAPKRLKAIPWAERCIGCQEKADGSSSQRGRMSNSEDWAEAA